MLVKRLSLGCSQQNAKEIGALYVYNLFSALVVLRRPQYSDTSANE